MLARDRIQHDTLGLGEHGQPGAQGAPVDVQQLGCLVGVAGPADGVGERVQRDEPAGRLALDDELLARIEGRIGQGDVAAFGMDQLVGERRPRLRTGKSSTEGDDPIVMKVQPARPLVPPGQGEVSSLSEVCPWVVLQLGHPRDVGQLGCTSSSSSDGSGSPSYAAAPASCK